MNRLHHLKQTLPKNIADNGDYPNIEFVLLDYNSSDGMEEWVKAEFKEEINSGLVTYFKVEDVEYFDRSHSRNMMFKLATGDIICNIDADNFTGENFANYINTVFNEKENIVLLTDTKRRYYYIRDCIGRFCAKKEDFVAIAGYDESMKGYGLEDDDLYERLLALGREETLITDFSFLQALKHGDEERTKNEFYTSNVHSFYVSYITPERSKVIFLYKDHTYNKGFILADNTSFVTLKIEGNVWEKGTWEETEKGFVLVDEVAQSTIYFKESEKIIHSKVSGHTYYKIENKAFLASLELQLPLITNKGRYLLNKENADYKVNANGFGKGKVKKNFTSELMSI